MSNIVPIAIIGIGCRLPGDANNPQQLWDMLHEGRSGQVPIPADRWNAESFYHPDQNAKQSLNFKSGYFLKHDPAAFDARFFGIPPREANGMDPQQRLLLETTYEALEHAGIPLERLKGSDTSVFVAEFTRDYDRMANKDLSQLHLLHVTGKGDAILSNRISYLFDLRGPSLTIDTGCVSVLEDHLHTWGLIYLPTSIIVGEYGCSASSVPKCSHRRVEISDCGRRAAVVTPRPVYGHESDRV